MSDDSQTVWKSQHGTYHVTKECVRYKSADTPMNEISLELAEEWDLNPCSFCIGDANENGNGRGKWARRIARIRESDN